MALKRIMGTETEYGISGGTASSVVAAYLGKKRGHENLGKTNESIIASFTDVGGHNGGDYGFLDEQLAEAYGIHYPSQMHRTPIYAYKRTPTCTYAGPDDMIDNGARFYVDMDHPEYCTPETSNPRDLVIADKAGELIVLESAKKADPSIKIYKNNSDSQGNSYGCHENYLMKRYSSSDFQNVVVPALIPFFITRQIYAGAGKIGIEHERANSYSSEGYRSDRGYAYLKSEALRSLESLSRHFLDIPSFSQVQELLSSFLQKRQEKGEQQIYQLSQRADFFTETIGLQTTYNRPIINTRDEPHADSGKYMRLHVILGDANLCEIATYLKTGTTALVLDLIEEGFAPALSVKDPVRQHQEISLDQSRKWILHMEDGKTISAVDIQRMYLEAAKKAYAGRDPITNHLLGKWESTLDALVSDPLELMGTVDWVTKLGLLQHLMEKDDLSLTDQKIRNAALQYHDINRETGLFYYLQKNNLAERISTDEEIINAVLNPPEDTRAYLRTKIGETCEVSQVDWSGFTLKTSEGEKKVSLLEPFSGTKEQIGYLLQEQPERIIEELRKTPGISVEKKPSWFKWGRGISRRLKTKYKGGKK